MQRAAGEATVGQVGIDGRQAEGQGFALFLHPGHEPAQFGQHGGAVLRHGKGGWPDLENHGIFTVCSCSRILEQNRNNAKGERVQPLFY
jgi:hypothetical protein